MCLSNPNYYRVFLFVTSCDEPNTRFFIGNPGVQLMDILCQHFLQ